MIIDGFIFYNELHLLKLRLTELWDVVDHFILVEATKTFTGNSKNLVFQDHKNEFVQFSSKIIHIVVEDMPNTKNPWEREAHQRNAISRGIQQLKPVDSDIIIISDIDEIPDPLTLADLKKIGISNAYCLECDMFYYDFTNKFDYKWYHPKIGNFGTLKKYSPEQIRTGKIVKVIKKGGWHLSYFSNPETIMDKISNFSHQEQNLPDLNKSKIKDLIANHKDLFNREDPKYTPISLNSYLPKNLKIILPENYEDDFNQSLYKQFFGTLPPLNWKTVCFIHMATLLPNVQMLNYFLDYISRSRAIDLFDFIYIDNSGVPINLQHPKIFIYNYSPDFQGSPRHALNLTHLFSKFNDDCNILFLSTNELSHVDPKMQTAYIDYHFFFFLNRVQQCTQLLAHHDLLTIQNLEWNFWFATSEYIESLKPMDSDELTTKWVISKPNCHLFHLCWVSPSTLMRTDYDNLKIENMIQSSIFYPLPPEYLKFFNPTVSTQYLYGAGDKFIDVQQIMENHFIKNSMIIIPQNTAFNDFFGDPIDNKIKMLIIKNNQEFYGIAENETIHEIRIWIK